MHYLIEKYGKPMMRELLDIIVIKQGKIDNADWRHFLIKHGVIKQSTKTIRASNFNEVISHTYGYDENAQFTRMPLDEPYTRHGIRLKNGRRELVFNVDITSTDIPKISEEL